MPKIFLKPDAKGNIVIPKEMLQSIDGSQGFEVYVDSVASPEFPSLIGAAAIWQLHNSDELAWAAMEMLKEQNVKGVQPE